MLVFGVLMCVPAIALANLPAPWPAADDIGSAVYAPPGIQGRFDSTSDSDDVFSVYLLAGERIFVAVDRDSGTGAIPYLYGPGTTTVVDNTGYLIEGTASTSDADLMGFMYTATATGHHYIDVWVPSEGDAGNYTLWWSAEWGNPTSGIYDNDSTPGVPLRSFGFVADGYDDDDVYSVRMSSGDNFTAIMTPQTVTDAEGPWPAADFDLFFYKPGAPSVGAESDAYVVRSSKRRGAYSEKISYVAPATGTYSLDVWVFGGAGDYDLKYGTLTAPQGKLANAYCYLTPKVAAGTYPVVFQAARKINGKWVVKYTKKAKATTVGSRTRCNAKLSLSSRYTWRVRVMTTTGGLGARYSGYAPVTWR